MTTRILIRPNRAGVVPMVVPLAVVHPTVLFIGPRSHAATGSSALPDSGFIAGFPALASAHAHRGFVQILERSRNLLRVTHLLHQFSKLFRGSGQRLGSAGLVARLHLTGSLFQVL